MNTSDTIKIYDERAHEFAARYEALSFEDVHEQVLDLMPAKGESAFVLDVGAGSGRDAAWFARNGCEVVAVEPSGKMIEAPRQLHGESTITWIQDRLPSLEKTIRSGLSFDLILVSAVWMHVAAADRARAFRKLVSLLKAGGKIIISLNFPKTSPLG